MKRELLETSLFMKLSKYVVLKVKSSILGQSVAWSDMSPGAKQRYDQQANHWKMIRSEMHTEAPGLAKKLDIFYNKGNKQ
jgi:hypothetical protein